MITINQIKDSFAIDTSNSYVTPIEDLKDFWPRYTREERKAFRTTKKRHMTIDAKWVIDRIIEDATEDGYEEMYYCCREQITDDQIDKLQKVFDEITSNEAWDVYMPDEEIDPDVEVTEEMPKQADIKDN